MAWIKKKNVSKQCSASSGKRKFVKFKELMAYVRQTLPLHKEQYVGYDVLLNITRMNKKVFNSYE